MRFGLWRSPPLLLEEELEEEDEEREDPEVLELERDERDELLSEELPNICTFSYHCSQLITN